MQLMLSCVSLSLAKFTIFFDKSLLGIPLWAIWKISFSSTTSHTPSEAIITNISFVSTFLQNISGVDNLEYKVLKLKYYENRTFTLQQIADRLNYSLDRIKQVSADVEKKLKSNL